MSNRENLKREIENFIKDDKEKVMLITGTHQYEKHLEVLRVLNSNVKNGVRVLCRINSGSNIDILRLNLKNKKLNEQINAGNLKLYIDTINSRSWRDGRYNVSILYPVDSVCNLNDRQRREILNDLISRTNNKLFIVSWTDNEDYNWIDEFGVDRKVVFDAREEDEEYHNRVLENISRRY